MMAHAIGVGCSSFTFAFYQWETIKLLCAIFYIFLMELNNLEEMARINEAKIRLRKELVKRCLLA